MAFRYQQGASKLTGYDDNGSEIRSNDKGTYIDDATGDILSEDVFNQRQSQQAEDEKRKYMSSQGLNVDGSPIRKEYSSIGDGKGSLNDAYTLHGAKDINVNKEGIDAVRKMALRKGPSDWTNMMLEKQGIQAGANRDDLSSKLAGSRSQAMSDLAMRGGLSGGARERMAANSMRESNLARQSLSRNEALDKTNLLADDEKSRVNLLTQMPGLENEASKSDFANREYSTTVSKYNLDNVLKDKSAKDAWDSNTYNEQMKKWASDAQANATASSGGGGGK